MLIHLCPSLYSYSVDGLVSLLDVTSDELGVSLRGGVHLDARRPFPNKRYLVACRKTGQKALCGFLIDAPAWLWEFTVVTRWHNHTHDQVMTHRVHYRVLDDMHDAVSDKMVLWLGYQDEECHFKNRTPEDYGAPCTEQPCMEVVARMKRPSTTYDAAVDRYGCILERSESLRIPSIEKERIIGPCSIWDRMPFTGSAFVGGNTISLAHLQVLGVGGESVARQ